MTVKDLYDELKAIHCEDYDIYINGSDIGMFKYVVEDEVKTINFDQEKHFN